MLNLTGMRYVDFVRNDKMIGDFWGCFWVFGKKRMFFDNFSSRHISSILAVSAGVF